MKKQDVVSEKTILITIKGGVVVEVEGLPEGYWYDVLDIDDIPF